MQYRTDHLENAKADGVDAMIYPIRKITGDSANEKYEMKPGAEWHVPLNGDVELVYPDPQVLLFDSQVSLYQQEMEEFAGLPRETAGFRTPGEKTGFEVDALMNAAQEFPDEKLAEFESQFLEPLLNLCLELNIRNIDQFDIDSIPAENMKVWSTVEIDDLKVDGRLFPVGIKHSKQRAEKVQKIQAMIQLGTEFAPEHISKITAMLVLQEEFNLDEDGIIEFGIGLKEALALQKAQQQLVEQEEREDPDAPAQQAG